MKVWTIDEDINNYASFCVREEDYSDIFIEGFNGVPMKQEWKIVPIQVMEEDRDMLLPDYGYLQSRSVLSAKAVEALQDLVENEAELLPVLFDKGEYYVLNVIDVVDCVDLDSSIYDTYSSGKIRNFEKIAFIREKITGKHMFKIANKATALGFYVSDEFHRRVLSLGLTGFKFKEVWDSESES